MRLSSPLQARKYLTSVKMRMSGHFDHHERFTGFFLGSFFHITHHAEYEWDRRYKSPKNAAVGYIKQTADGCEIRFFLARGLLCPAQFLGFFLFFCVVLTSMLAWNGILNEVGLPVSIGISFAATLLPSLVSAFFEGATDRSWEGREALLAMLKDPTDPFLYLKQ